MHRSQRVYSKMNNLGNSSVSRSNSSRSVSSVASATSATSSASSAKSESFKKSTSYKKEIKNMVKSTSTICKTITKL